MYCSEKSKVSCPFIGRFSACRSMGHDAEPQLASSRSAVNARRNSSERRRLMEDVLSVRAGMWDGFLTRHARRTIDAERRAVGEGLAVGRRRLADDDEAVDRCEQHRQLLLLGIGRSGVAAIDARAALRR